MTAPWRIRDSRRPRLRRRREMQALETQTRTSAIPGAKLGGAASIKDSSPDFVPALAAEDAAELSRGFEEAVGERAREARRREDLEALLLGRAVQRHRDLADERPGDTLRPERLRMQID